MVANELFRWVHRDEAVRDAVLIGDVVAAPEHVSEIERGLHLRGCYDLPARVPSALEGDADEALVQVQVLVVCVSPNRSTRVNRDPVVGDDAIDLAEAIDHVVVRFLAG